MDLFARPVPPDQFSVVAAALLRGRDFAIYRVDDAEISLSQGSEYWCISAWRPDRDVQRATVARNGQPLQQSDPLFNPYQILGQLKDSLEIPLSASLRGKNFTDALHGNLPEQKRDDRTRVRVEAN